jgi:exopolysaccharide production protein ExoZ
MGISGERHLGGVDLVRFFAALLVAIVHLCFSAWGRDYSMPYKISGGGFPLPAFSSVTRCCWVGVEVFFVISGLVIAKSANGRSAYSFVKGRLGRLMPAIWICATVTLLITLTLNLTHWKWALYEYARTAVLFLDRPWIDEVYWTLSVEIVFYALIACILLMNAFRHIAAFAWTLAAISALYLGLRLIGLPDGIPYTMPLQYGCFFSVGIALWMFSEFGLSSESLSLFLASVVVCLVEISVKTVDQAELIGDPAVPYLGHAVWLVALVSIIFSLRNKFGNDVTRRLGPDEELPRALLNFMKRSLP